MANFVVKTNDGEGRILGKTQADYHRCFSNMVKFFNDSGTSAFPDEQVDLIWVSGPYVVERDGKVIDRTKLYTA